MVKVSYGGQKLGTETGSRCWKQNWELKRRTKEIKKKEDHERQYSHQA